MKTSFIKGFAVLVLVLAGANLVYLNYAVFGKPRPSVTESRTIPTADSYPSVEDREGSVSSEMVDLIEEATRSLTLRVDNLTPTSQSTTASVAPVSGTVKEFYIPLGTGSTNSEVWVDLPGVEAYVNPANYGKITGLYFEATMRLPTGTGKAFARLKNVTDNNPLIESEVSQEGDGSSLISSAKIPTPTATKLYRVQVRSSLSEMKLDNARIKIIVE